VNRRRARRASGARNGCAAAAAEARPKGPAKALAAVAALVTRVARLPDPAQETATIGLKKVVGFQDTAYGAEYLDRLEALAEERGGCRRERQLHRDRGEVSRQRDGL
jgi:hypothetical protein